MSTDKITGADADLPDNEFMEDREVFSFEDFERDGKRGKRLYVSEAARKRWRADKRNPRKFTPELALEMLECFAVGGLVVDVCAAVGIVHATLDNWKNQARERKDDKEDYTGRSTDELRAFVTWMGRKRALRRIEALARIRRAAAEDRIWQADAWYLERSDPNNWRQRNSVIPENADGTPYTGGALKPKSSEELIREVAAMQAALKVTETTTGTDAPGTPNPA